ncbi:uncharacterized protein LOC141749489 [Larus michahellis]|uniref:uncharacterized protein LOC141749489 n=1 Tax=Larus michahellis TaxID=119627 RepID=UPI003D9BBB45
MCWRAASNGRPLFAAAAGASPRLSAPLRAGPAARPPGRRRYLRPLAAVSARRCAPAAGPAERCGATSSAEREETVIYKRFLPDLSCLLSNEGALSITHPAEWKNTGTASSLLGRGEPKGRGVGEEGPCRRHGGGARAGRRPRGGGEGRAGAGQRPPPPGGAAPGRPPSPAGSGAAPEPARREPALVPRLPGRGGERRAASRGSALSSLHFCIFFKKIFFFFFFNLYTKSALLTDKASRGIVTSAAPPCSRALALLLRGRFSPREGWRGLGLRTRCRPARLLGHLGSATGSCWRKPKGAWPGSFVFVGILC